MKEVKLKRIYEKAEKEDGIRILVDRLWPRGISKEAARLDHWLKKLAPSNELRKALHQDEVTFEVFTSQYKEELKTGEQKEAFSTLQDIIEEASQQVTILFAAKDEAQNNANVLKELLR